MNRVLQYRDVLISVAWKYFLSWMHPQSFNYIVSCNRLIRSPALIISHQCISVYIRQILEKTWEYNGTEHQLSIDFKKAYDSVRREILYNILIEYGIPRKLVVLIKMCLNETYSRVCTGKNLTSLLFKMA
jgi:hypothetical protein